MDQINLQLLLTSICSTVAAVYCTRGEYAECAFYSRREIEILLISQLFVHEFCRYFESFFRSNITSFIVFTYRDISMFAEVPTSWEPDAITIFGELVRHPAAGNTLSSIASACYLLCGRPGVLISFSDRTLIDFTGEYGIDFTGRCRIDCTSVCLIDFTGTYRID